ncbi:MAG: hypothetical protein AB7Q29_15735 [Vicinamibacterales bacterium]
MKIRIGSGALAAAGCGLGFLAIVAFLAVARAAADAPSTSDTAVIESYTRFASEGRLTVGAYSRFQWHHPGPLPFYLLAPFYVLSGERTAGLHAGAAALSLISLALACAVLLRRRSVVSIPIFILLGLLSVRAADALVSPWNPHVPSIPLAALIVVAADAIAGAAWMLPVVAALASLAGQAHIALFPCVVSIGGIAVARAIAGTTGEQGRRWRGALAVTGLVLAVLWAVPLYEQVSGLPRGNLTELWRFFAEEPRSGQPFSTALSAWSDMLVGPLRPDFYVAHGWPFEESRVRWAEALSVLAVAVTCGFAIRVSRAGRQFDAALGGVAVVASLVALWSATRVEERIFDHDVFWIAAVGVILLGAACGFVLSALTGLTLAPRLARIAAFGVVLLLGFASSLGALRSVQRASHTPSNEARIARAVADDLQAYLDAQRIRRPVIRIDQDAWGVAAGAILDLQKRGYDVAVEEDWVVMFTPQCRHLDSDDGWVTVAAPAEHLRLTDRGAPLVSAHEPIFVHADPAAP